MLAPQTKARLDAAFVLQQIDNLKREYPFIWDDGDDQLLTDCLSAETDFNEMLTVIVDRMRDAASMADGIASRVAELESRRDRYSRREQAMRVLAFKLMEFAELKKAELPEATLSIRNNPPKVLITDEDAIPDPFCRITRSPDKAKIKDSLTHGVPVQGAELSNSEPSLAIRTK